MLWTLERNRAACLVSLALLLSFAFSLASSAASLPYQDAPAVVMDTTTRNFGDVFAGEELEQIFLVRNAGTKPLELAQKSTLSAVPVAPRYAIAAALTGARGKYITRNVAAVRAAPS